MENKLDKQLQFIEMRAKGNSFDRIAKKTKGKQENPYRVVQSES